MVNLLHFSHINKDEISSVLNKTEDISVKNNFIITSNKFNFSTDKKNVILVGICDYMVNDLDFYVKLVDARNQGIPILFTHGNPTHFAEILKRNMDETEEQYKERLNDRKNLYFNVMANFGIEGFLEGKYNFFNNIAIKIKSHPIVKTPFKITEYVIQEIHDIGTILSSKCNIILNDGNRQDSNTNYYLATYEEEGKGKVVHCQIGHNNYDSKYFNIPEKIECMILVNALTWLVS